KAATRWISHRGPPCCRGARRNDERAGDRRASARPERAGAMTEGTTPTVAEAARHGIAKATSHSAGTQSFKGNAKAALGDRDLQNALKFVEVNFIARRQEVADRLPEFEALRDAARDIKNHTLAYLDLYLEAYERRVTEQGGNVHYAVTA